MKRIHPITSYFHQDPRPDKFGGTSLTGVQAYMGNEIPHLTGSIVFTDLANQEPQSPIRGVLAYTRASTDCKPNDFGVIETDYNFSLKQPIMLVWERIWIKQDYILGFMAL